MVAGFDLSSGKCILTRIVLNLDKDFSNLFVFFNYSCYELVLLLEGSQFDDLIHT